jgi:hypothetical protein
LLVLAALALLWFFLLKPIVESTARDEIPENVPQSEDLDNAEARLNEALAAQAAAAAKQDKALQKQLDALAGTAGGAGGPTTEGRLAVATTGLAHFPDTAEELAQASFPVAKKKELRVTDLVLQNPNGDFGILTLRRDGPAPGFDDAATILVVRLENFRDLDYHFVTPLVFAEGTSLVMTVDCKNAAQPSVADRACTPAVYYTGFTAEAQK